MKIVIDTGHTLSGSDTGARGNGYKEELCTREIGSKVIEKLKALGHTVVSVAPDSASSVNESLNLRISRENAANADLSVSIHLNAGGGQGTEVFTYKGEKVPQAVAVLNNIVGLGYKNRGIKDGSGLALISRTKATAMLIECCFIDSASDMAMYNAEKLANAIVKGLVGKTVESQPAGWVKDSTGWLYRNADGSYPKNKWEKINNLWYYFGENGYAYSKKWLQDNNKWYYFYDDCNMVTSDILKIDGKFYCFNKDGIMLKNTQIKVEDSGQLII